MGLKNRLIWTFILGLAIAGLVDTAYLTVLKVAAPAGGCGGGGCSGVLSGPLSMVAGFPLSIWGMGFYALISYWTLRRPNRGRLIAIRAVSGIATLISIGLVAAQATGQAGWCQYCLISAGLVGGILGLSWLIRYDGDRDSSRSVWVLGAGSLIAFGLPFLLFSGYRMGETYLELKPQYRVVAKIGDRQVTQADIQKSVIHTFAYTDMLRRDAQKEWLDQEVLKTEAKRNGVTIQGLFDLQAKQLTVNSVELVQYAAKRGYDYSSLGPEDRAAIEGAVRRRKFKNDYKKDYILSLRRQYKVAETLPPPPLFDVPKNPYGSASWGKKDAPIKVVVFSNLLCSYCGQTHQVIKEWQRRYPTQLHIEYRFLPAPALPVVDRLHYGAICAGQQNRFWELASALFEHQKELTSDENVFDYARVLGIDSKQLAACMDSEGVKKSVAFDIQLADEWFITVTPAVFINQEYYPGVPAIDLIERYLPRHRD